MPYYDLDYFHNTLKWSDIFESATEFITKVTDITPAGIGGITDTADLTELYQILSNKYLFSHTRYETEETFIFALKRELYSEFPFYLEKKALAKQMIDIEIAEVQRGQRQLQNRVDTHDDPVTDADRVPISDLSTEQMNIETTTNKLMALKDKYNVQNRNFLQGIYKRCDELFRVILSRDEIPLYEVEE